MTTAATSTQASIESLLARIGAGEHLAHDEWKRVIIEAPTESLQQRADELRFRLHPDNAVTYVVDRNINYTNVCFSVCNFCAFYRKPGHPEAYVLSYEEIYDKVEEMIGLGGSVVGVAVGVLMMRGIGSVTIRAPGFSDPIELPVYWGLDQFALAVRQIGRAERGAFGH